MRVCDPTRKTPCHCSRIAIFFAAEHSAAIDYRGTQTREDTYACTVHHYKSRQSVDEPTCLCPPAECAFALNSILTVNPNPGANPFVGNAQRALAPYIVNQFEVNGGLFPSPTHESLFSARLDHRFSNSDQAFVRYSYAHLTEKNPDVQALTGFSRGTSELAWDSTAQIGWFHLFNPSTQNEARFQWNWYQFNVNTNDPGGPGLDVEGFGFFGRQIFLPSFTTARRYEFADNLSLTRGHHTIRMGFAELIRGNNTSSQTFFPGRFEFLELPGALVSLCLEAPAVCGLPATQVPGSLSTLQAWSLGLPAFYEQGFGNPSYKRVATFHGALRASIPGPSAPI